MKNKDFFRKDNYYVIHNYGNGSEDIFKRQENYFYFLRKHDEYMSENWQLIAWSLLPGRYTLLVKIKNDFPSCDTPEEINKKIYTDFGHFTNGFAKAINKEWRRKGSLFAKNFSRRIILRKYDLKKIIYGMHLDPVKNNIISSADWKFSDDVKTFSNVHAAQFLEMIKFFENWENSIANRVVIGKMEKAA